MAAAPVTVTLNPTNEGVITGPSGIWSAARDATTGAAANYTSSTAANAAIRVSYATGRSGAVWYINRSFLRFDTSGIDGTVSSVFLKVAGVSYGTADVIVVKSDAFNGVGNSLVNSDFDNLDFGTAYSSEDPTWNLNAYNSISLNATAKTDIENLSVFRVALIDYDYDYNNTQSASETRSGIWFQDGTYPIELEVTYTPPGFGGSVNTVDGANIANINTVDLANISSMNTVDFTS